jgi:hypothetical protein
MERGGGTSGAFQSGGSDIGSTDDTLVAVPKGKR